MRHTTIVLLAAALLAGALPTSAAERVASAGTAYVMHDAEAGAWNIGNDHIRATFELVPGRDSRLAHLTNVSTGRDWASAAPFAGTTVIDGRRSTVGAPANGFDLLDVVGQPVGEGAVALSATYLQRDSRLRVVRTYTVFAGSAAIDIFTRFEAGDARTSVTLSDISLWQLTLAGERLEWVNGLRGDNNANPVDAAFAIQRRELPLAAPLDFGSAARSSEQTVPYFKLTAGSDAIVGGLVWSGAWRFTASPQGSGVALSMDLSDVTSVVDTDHALETPHAFLVLASDAAPPEQAVRDYAVQGLRAGRPFAALVTYNTWFAYGTRVDEASMLDELDRVSELGAELFVLDAGWYPGAGANDRWDFASGLGNWHADEDRFPSGLRALSDAAHDHGMKFGLWVEPSRVALGNVGGAGQVREEWLATTGGQYDPATQMPTNAKICLSGKAAREWVIAEMSRLIDEARPDYLKWDNNFWINCDRPGHGHGQSDGNLRQVQGLYAVLAAIRARYPHLLIENVSGGGNRLDYGLLQYTDVAWVDDRSAPSLHVRHNLEGLAAAFPPGYLLSFVMDADTESLHDGKDIPLYIRSRMPAVLGLTFRTVDLRRSVADEIRDHVARFKEIRDTIAQGTAVTLTGQTTVDAPLPWDVMQVSDGTRTILFAFQVDAGAGRIVVSPRGLKPDTTYEVQSLDTGLVGTATGRDIAANGVEIDEAPRSAAHILILTAQPTPASVPRRR